MKKKETDQTSVTESTNGTAKRTRRTSTELFFDAAKEHKAEIASLEAQLDKAKKDYAAFVDSAKAALEI